MADFSTTASLELEVASGSLRDVKSTIEQELGEMEIGVGADTGGAGGRQQGQLAGILDANRQQFDLAEERNELLDEMLEELEDQGGLLSGAGGGATMFGGGAGAAAGGAGGGAIGGILGTLTALAPAARLAGGGISPGLFGKGGAIDTSEKQETGPIMSLLFGDNPPQLGEDSDTGDGNGDDPFGLESTLSGLSDTLTGIELPDVDLAEEEVGVHKPPWIPIDVEPIPESEMDRGQTTRGPLEGATQTQTTENITVNNQTTIDVTVEDPTSEDEIVDRVQERQERDLDNLKRQLKQGLPSGY